MRRLLCLLLALIQVLPSLAALPPRPRPPAGFGGAGYAFVA
ncbi:hypothetical protein [Armatimonas sp.]